jgi:hypothetical protein
VQISLVVSIVLYGVKQKEKKPKTNLDKDTLPESMHRVSVCNFLTVESLVEMTLSLLNDMNKRIKCTLPSSVPPFSWMILSTFWTCGIIKSLCMPENENDLLV